MGKPSGQRPSGDRPHPSPPRLPRVEVVEPWLAVVKLTLPLSAELWDAVRDYAADLADAMAEAGETP